MRLGGIILGTSYLLGMSWYIFSDIEQSHPDTFLDSTGEMFYTEYGLGERSKLEVCSGMIYYAFTTLSTVGFGDFHPKNKIKFTYTAPFEFAQDFIYKWLHQFVRREYQQVINPQEDKTPIMFAHI